MSAVYCEHGVAWQELPVEHEYARCACCTVNDATHGSRCARCSPDQPDMFAVPTERPVLPTQAERIIAALEPLIEEGIV